MKFFKDLWKTVKGWFAHLVAKFLGWWGSKTEENTLSVNAENNSVIDFINNIASNIADNITNIIREVLDSQSGAIVPYKSMLARVIDWAKKLKISDWIDLGKRLDIANWARDVFIQIAGRTKEIFNQVVPDWLKALLDDGKKTSQKAIDYSDLSINNDGMYIFRENVGLPDRETYQKSLITSSYASSLSNLKAKPKANFDVVDIVAYHAVEMVGGIFKSFNQTFGTHLGELEIIKTQRIINNFKIKLHEVEYEIYKRIEKLGNSTTLNLNGSSFGINDNYIKQLKSIEGDLSKAMRPLIKMGYNKDNYMDMKTYGELTEKCEKLLSLNGKTRGQIKDIIFNETQSQLDVIESKIKEKLGKSDGKEEMAMVVLFYEFEEDIASLKAIKSYFTMRMRSIIKKGYNENGIEVKAFNELTEICEKLQGKISQECEKLQEQIKKVREQQEQPENTTASQPRI